MNDLVKVPQRNAVWDVFNDFDGFFNDFLRSSRVDAERGQALTPAVDVSENDNEYRIKADLPGVKKEDIDVNIRDGVLTISAESKFEHEEQADGRLIRRERRYGKYLRSMRLGSGVDADKVKAEYHDGVLELYLPKKEAVKPKRIDVTVN